MVNFGKYGTQDSNGDLIFVAKQSDDAVYIYKMSIDTDVTFVAGKRFTLDTDKELIYGPKPIATDSSNNIYLFLGYKRGTYMFIKMPSTMADITIKYI